ncbi:hypothetical protein OSSY52_21180 [Tepiditoga spiralis]|uniref:Uncharacterized protein n=1 Tax=Tepiditoga spiralis TaxID=2108365 RepID=A0A7G1GA82_9BACT|nr:hypothetical protein [Tepiditoga spiralis]BBE31977.1 hypothetical protein OSSY52_21180 [Tepiditoga spiralis]
MNKNELVYFMAFSKIKSITLEKRNKIIYFLYNYNYTLKDFFEKECIWKSKFKLNEEETKELKETKNKLANFTFILEKIENDGYEIIPCTSKHFPVRFQRIPLKFRPILIFIKGNKELLKHKLYYIYGKNKKYEYIIKNSGDNILINNEFTQNKCIHMIDIDTFEISKEEYKLYSNNEILIIGNNDFPYYIISDYIFFIEVPNLNFYIPKEPILFIDNDLNFKQSKFTQIKILKNKLIRV